MADMIGGLPEQNYQLPLEPNYSREMYQMRSVDSSFPADCSHRPTHLPVNFEYMNESYQSRLVVFLFMRSCMVISNLLDHPLGANHHYMICKTRL